MNQDFEFLVTEHKIDRYMQSPKMAALHEFISR
jgi:hypothetical protein